MLVLFFEIENIILSCHKVINQDKVHIFLVPYKGNASIDLKILNHLRVLIDFFFKF